MKTTKKIIALMMALVMVLGMSTAAMAAGDTGRTVNSVADTYAGTGDEKSLIPENTTVIPLTKSIVFINANGSAVYEPDISFTYTVTPAGVTDGEHTITASTGSVSRVLNGIAESVEGMTISFGPVVGGEATTPVTTSATGVDVERTGNLAVDLTKFTRAGIYRYLITETSNPTDITTKGLTARVISDTEHPQSVYKNTRYLDIYIRNNSEGTGFEMYGAVIFKTTAEEAGKDNITINTTKTTGFGPTSGTLKDDPTVDRYTTYDVSVKKNVQGSLADRSHEFPFFVTIANSIAGAKITYSNDGSETITGATKAEQKYTLTAADFTIGEDAKTSSLKLKHNDTITIIGVPSNQTTDLTITVKEYNDSHDVYTPSVEATSGIAPHMASTNAKTGNSMTALSGFDSTTAFSIPSNDIANQTIQINNLLSEVSPTGYFVRFAPYALILVGGIVLMLIAVKRKKHHDEED